MTDPNKINAVACRIYNSPRARAAREARLVRVAQVAREWMLPKRLIGDTPGMSAREAELLSNNARRQRN